jgi:general secretion pathway protein I
MIAGPRAARRGLTLLEVLVSLTIFLISIAVLGQMVRLASSQALDVRRRNQATQLCQSKLAEVMAGAVPLQSQSDVPFDEDADWRWSLDCNQGDIANLWSVTVKVHRQGEDNPAQQVALSRMVLDPSQRGSSFDNPAPAATAADPNSQSGSGSGSGASGAGSSTGSGAASGMGTGAGSMSPAATTPAATTPSAPRSGGSNTPSSSPTVNSPAGSGSSPAGGNSRPGGNSTPGKKG